MKIGVVIVTYNRIEKLKKALECYENQTRLPDYILVVDNNSSDGTDIFLDDWKKNCEREVLTLTENLGGSGGFYYGLKEMIKKDVDWIWVSDDDAYPKHEVFENLEKFIEKNSIQDVGAICGKIINNGKIDLNHRRIYKKSLFRIKEYPVPKIEYDNEYFKVDLFSYVGTAIKKEVLKEVGLTKKEYFIFFDDTEHSYRISRNNKILCVPSIEIIHDIEGNYNKEDLIEWKKYYGIRNHIDCIKSNFPSRYYKVLLFKYRMDVVKIKDNVEKELIKDGIKDGKKGNLGLNNKYYPGWKYIKKET